MSDVINLAVNNQRLGSGATNDTVLQSIIAFVKDNGILEEWDESDVELEYPTSDERRIDKLTSFERELFIISALCQHVSTETRSEIEAKNTDAIGEIIRTNKVQTAEAVQIFAQRTQGRGAMDEETRDLLFQCTYIAAMCNNLYHFSLITRTDAGWHNRIIIRKGFVAYAYTQYDYDG